MRTRSHTRYLALILLALYLFVPWRGIAGTIFPENSTVGFSAVAPAPCQDCPCSDSHGANECDTGSCPCACHAPSPGMAKFPYAPLVLVQRMPEQRWALPQICRPIYVPPQNLPAA